MVFYEIQELFGNSFVETNALLGKCLDIVTQSPNFIKGNGFYRPGVRLEWGLHRGQGFSAPNENAHEEPHEIQRVIVKVFLISDGVFWLRIRRQRSGDALEKLPEEGAFKDMVFQPVSLGAFHGAVEDLVTGRPHPTCLDIVMCPGAALGRRSLEEELVH
jgi:hypothetical protein